MAIASISIGMSWTGWACSSALTSCFLAMPFLLDDKVAVCFLNDRPFNQSTLRCRQSMSHLPIDRFRCGQHDHLPSNTRFTATTQRWRDGIYIFVALDQWCSCLMVFLRCCLVVRTVRMRVSMIEQWQCGIRIGWSIIGMGWIGTDGGCHNADYLYRWDILLRQRRRTIAEGTRQFIEAVWSAGTSLEAMSAKDKSESAKAKTQIIEKKVERKWIIGWLISLRLLCGK